MTNDEEFDLKNPENLKINIDSSELRKTQSANRPMDVSRYTKNIFTVKNKLVREFLAEILSTFVLISFGCGSVAQYILGGKNTFNSFLSVNLSWGLGVTMGILVAGKISGAHMNPAVSLSMLLLGKITPLKFIVYLIGQCIGAFLGSVLVFVVYLDALNAFDGGIRQTTGHNATAGIWATYPAPHLSILGGFLDQVFGTALLVLIVLAVSDSKNAEIQNGINALLTGCTVILIGMTFGCNCGYGINPVRDFIPRLFTSIAGWGTEVYTAYNYFFWVPVIGPFVGAILSTFLYSFLISNHWPDDTAAGYINN